jgi:hypothetical protein
MYKVLLTKKQAFVSIKSNLTRKDIVKWKDLKEKQRYLLVESSRVSDPCSFDPDPDPAFEAEYRSRPESNQDTGLWWRKIGKNTQLEKN